MTPPRESPKIYIVGAGPVGLLLGCCLQRRGIPCRILERNAAPSDHSRSIGIHPPSLEVLADLRLADRFLAEGVKVQKGLVSWGDRRLGVLSFEGCKKPYNFVLSLPQDRTEAILEECLEQRAPGTVLRGVAVHGVRQEKETVLVDATDREGSAVTFEGRIAVGCDGKSSAVRESAGLEFQGEAYGESFLLGDSIDRTPFGSDASIFLGPQGVLESFPLPGGVRRWVARLPSPDPGMDADSFCDLVMERSGQEVLPEECIRLNTFNTEHFLAPRWRRGRIVLAGDAAHIMSPLGGQGMNVGWLDAWDLSLRLARIIGRGLSVDAELGAYERRGLKRARKAIRRAAWNLSFARGRGKRSPHILFTRMMLHTPLRHYFARLFTLRGL